MERIDTDILIAGGGIAGMTATAAFAASGFKTICVDPTPPMDGDDPSADLRSTAFLQPALELFAECGLWEPLSPYGARLDVMRLADAGGAENRIRETADFHPSEIGQESFGQNLPNWRLRQVLAAHLGGMPEASLISPARLVRITRRLNDVVALLSDGRQIRARLLIGADGRGSFVRTSSGISARRWEYGQKALVFVVSHPEPHQNVSTEIHRTGGPFTLVPLPDQHNGPHSAVVWMETVARADALMALDDTAFNQAAHERSCDVLGPLTLAGRRAAWPIISQIAARFDAPRTALIAEAAHVMPPIGAQGLNTSLADVRALRDLVTAAAARGEDIASPALLTRYHRARHADSLLRVNGIHALNRAAMADAQPIRDIRGLGLKLLHGIKPLRTAAMRMGLGA